MNAFNNENMFPDLEDYIGRLSQYIRYLKENYGVSVDDLTNDLFDHLKVEAERYADPRSAVLRMAHEAGLVHCGVMLPDIKSVGKYNKYVLALREYAIEKDQKIQPVTGAVFCDVGEPGIIVPYMEKRHHKDGSTEVHCGYKIFDMDGRFLAFGPDIEDTIEMSRENVIRMKDEDNRNFRIGGV